MANEWGHLPDGCPPADATPPTMTVFRITYARTPSPKDFETHRQLYPRIKFDDECDACGISVYLTFDDADKRRRRIPRLKKRGRVAVAQLSPQWGLIKNTSAGDNGKHDSHHTWWIAVGTQPWTIFEVVDRARR
ncbi:MAG TPA: hypothetical protein VFB32_08810 [Rudaea sp.]|nr:hypothetical protein [Rudaea sp.]